MSSVFEGKDFHCSFCYQEYANWNLDRDGEGELVNREHSHAKIVQAFLSGGTCQYHSR